MLVDFCSIISTECIMELAGNKGSKLVVREGGKTSRQESGS